jgi:hypothetical protein
MKTPEQIAQEALAPFMERSPAMVASNAARLIEKAVTLDRAQHQRPVGLEDTERIVHYWSRKHGDCEECSDPAAYLVLDAYGDGKHMPTCSVCAAYQAAQGQAIRKIEE